MTLEKITQGHTNFVFIGEAGCGKSELALNLAYELVKEEAGEVHFFDLDMTKPLFRSRDDAEDMRREGIIVHFVDQFMDAPTTSGGVRESLCREDQYTIIDVGGDYIGARSIGGYAPFLNRPNTAVYYMVNSFRVWSYDLAHIDAVLGQILSVSHIRLENLHVIANCNLGLYTTADDVVEGSRQVIEQVGPYKPVEFCCVWDALYDEVSARMPGEWLSVKLRLSYPWEDAEGLWTAAAGRERASV